MNELVIAVLGSDADQRSIVQMQVDATAVGKTALVSPVFPLSASDLLIRRLQDLKADVVVVDIPRQSPAAALHAIELLHAHVPKSAIFALGETNQSQVIISSMRSGAREFLERPTSTNGFLDAFVRLTSAQRKTQPGTRGKIFTVMNAKGGSGATTVAVNTALSLQAVSGSAALVDLAFLGHAALHLGVKPTFTITDAMQNVQRMDSSLLEAYMINCAGGLHLLAGAAEPVTEDNTSGDFAQLFELLASSYRYVVIDASSRIDQVARIVAGLSDKVLLVAHNDVASLWSTAKLKTLLSENSDVDRLRLVINRFRKIPGFNEDDIEAATAVKVISKIPNQYPLVAAAIDRGIPVAQQNHSEIAHAFVELAGVLSNSNVAKKRKHFSLFGA